MTHGIMLTLLAVLFYGAWGFSHKLLSLKQIQGEWVVALIMLFGAIISAALALARSEPLPLAKIGENLPWLALAAFSGAVGNILLVKAMAARGSLRASLWPSQAPIRWWPHSLPTSFSAKNSPAHRP